MQLIVAIVFCTVLAAVLKPVIKKHPWICYCLSAAIVALFASHILMDEVPVVARALYPYLQRCLLAFSLFTIVMYIGVLPDESSIRKYFAPIRGELSIIAAILTVGHIVNYANYYLAEFMDGFADRSATMVVSFVVSFVLIILLSALAVTSVNAVRKRMKSATWKRVQMLAYPFYVLVYVHLALILVPLASTFEQKAFFSIIVYTAIAGGYVIIRVRKACLDRRASKNLAYGTLDVRGRAVDS